MIKFILIALTLIAIFAGQGQYLICDTGDCDNIRVQLQQAFDNKYFGYHNDETIIDNSLLQVQSKSCIGHFDYNRTPTKAHIVNSSLIAAQRNKSETFEPVNLNPSVIE